MKKLWYKIKNFLQQKARGDSAAKHFIMFVYLFYANTYVQAIVSILGTVLIAVFIGRNYYGVFFWIVCVFYCVSVILIGGANRHIQEKIKDTQFFQSALYGISTVLRAWAISLQKSAGEFQKMDIRKEQTAVVNTLSKIDFQTAAFTVCEKLKNYLTHNRGQDDVYITVYQKYQVGDEFRCKMIAHSSDYEPTSYKTEYAIPNPGEELPADIEFHTAIFASRKTDIRVFADRESIVDAFKIHEGCETRESAIKQYIGIPISPAKQGVTFLLQVDTSVPQLFGKTESDVAEFAKNMIYPFSQFLHMIYEQRRTIDQLIK